MGEAHLLPEGRQIWLRAFYGFNPEEAGYFGFTREKQREDILESLHDGDLVLIYGAVGDLTDSHLKRQALGFLEVTTERCTDRERSAQSAINWKIEHGFQDRWTFGLKVRRAWRVRNRVHINTIAPEAYDNKNRFVRTTKAILLNGEERRRALGHTVFQVNVHGELQIPSSELAAGAILDLLTPSRGIPPVFETRSAAYEDGENWLYMMVLQGGSEALLGRAGPHVGEALVKVGRSNDPLRRLKEINSGFPDSALYRWKLVAKQMFPDGTTAHRLEDDLKNSFHKQFRSQGGEFYTGDERKIQQQFHIFCAKNMPAILGAPGKAAGVR